MIKYFIPEVVGQLAVDVVSSLTQQSIMRILWSAQQWWLKGCAVSLQIYSAGNLKLL
jgi:hypothetical protein